ncbi:MULTISPECIES: tyramine oxidase [unclassified Rhizobium]|uniref:copper amine oxidase n=1 Tax=unclassified Rhizobium TaxID=2613769 RepID=UPI0010DCA7E6|nr:MULTISPECIES: tyramine oxidase [unclassified Rhizobium]MBB3394811.1 primary-amine oxidase [Rhizobium sp. BK060]MBB4167588.1 primary-amine oxidase [Rhizobium sp. BK538]TCM78409.1 primary-amine oxidase [Rhizobium sp. BK068]
MNIKRYLASAGLLLALGAPAAIAHPLDGLTAEEYQKINKILRDQKVVDDNTLYPLIELKEPSKEEVLSFKEGDDQIDREAKVQLTSPQGFKETVVNITKGTVESTTPIKGQPMVLFTEFMDALQGALANPDMIAGLKKRGLTPEQAFCLPLTAGNFFTDEYENSRLMKVPCYKVPEGSNFYAKPIEGLFAVYDIGKRQVLRVIDTGVIDGPKDNWGYTEKEVAEREPLRPEMNPAKLSQPGGPNYKITGSHLEWDMWRMNFRVDKRPGLVVSNLDVKDGGTWRSVIYQSHLSEVFVPYMDPTEGWYWRTYMDSGEYGFGLFLSPLRSGVDCPDYATFLPATIADDKGNPLTIPNAICVFERSIGDPAWRHFEVFAQTPEKPIPAEGRPASELVVRTASEVGNYDYLIDYRLQQDGQIRIMIGATGLDAVKGVASTSMSDPTAAQDTAHGTLIAPNLVAANHDHYFNFRIDFDVDQPDNHFGTMDIVPAKVDAKNPRRSMWTVQHTMPKTEMEARYQLSAMKPRYFMISDPSREGYLGQEPGWMIHHGDVAYGPFDFAKDPPMKRNAYIEYSVWNTVYNIDQQYAGGKYAMQSDGSDTLPQWVKANKPLMGKDIVTWFTAGFHHIPRMEDWPVMSTEWKTIHIEPHNFFAHNPALTIRNAR